MALFGKQRAGGLMDEIRCDEQSYLIWKWHPYGSEPGKNRRENAIRWGSSIRVKEGEIAIFVYNQAFGPSQDVIVGPFTGLIETQNLPILADIIGLAYDGGTPFQAEVYFINQAQIIQVPFGVPYFDIYDPRYLDFGVPTAVRGKITFKISDYREFIKLHRLNTFDLKQFQYQVRDAMARYVKNIVMNLPAEKNIPVVQIEREIDIINNLLEVDVKQRFERDFGVDITAVDINAIEVDKTSEGYRQLKAITADLAAATAQAQTEINIKNMQDVQRINAENMEETLRIQREEAQYAQHKETQDAHFAAYTLEQQAAVGIAGAEALGQMGAGGGADISGGGGMNAAGMMAGIAMGGAIGQTMAGTMNNMMSGLNNQPVQSPTAPPPVPTMAYHVVINGEAKGPFDATALSQMITAGSLTKDSYVWKQGMPDWVKADTADEIMTLFNQSVPPVPGSVPPIPDGDV